jgi:hypothetical protein
MDGTTLSVGDKEVLIKAVAQAVPNRGRVPDLSVSGDKSDSVEDDPHDPTTTSKPEEPTQSLNQLPMVTDLVGASSARSLRSILVRSRRTNKNSRRAILISLEGGVYNTRR